MIKLLTLLTVFTAVACDADPDAYYYYGGPGYYHGYYSSGFKKYPDFYFNNLRKRRDAMQQHQSQTYISLLNPYRDITHYGYPHYYAYASPYFLNHRSKRQIRRNYSTTRRNQQTVGYYYGPNGYYGSPWWSGYGRWGYYSKPGNSPYSYTSPAKVTNDLPFVG